MKRSILLIILSIFLFPNFLLAAEVEEMEFCQWFSDVHRSSNCVTVKGSLSQLNSVKWNNVGYFKMVDERNGSDCSYSENFYGGTIIKQCKGGTQ